ncbi:MAG: hypothetical protein OEL78_00175 [Hyphomicrobiales bacterium]|nr:hypothetical protein [Hyphomicrobiales bacterium]
MRRLSERRHIDVHSLREKNKRKLHLGLAGVLAPSVGAAKAQDTSIIVVSHIASLARFLIGDIARVSARIKIVFPTRLGPDGAPAAITVDDQCHALLEFAGSASGALQTNWLAAGQTMQLAYEIIGTKWSIIFTQERFNELHLYQDGPDARTSGFRTITAGPAHESYGAFLPAPGHQLGFNDPKNHRDARFPDCHRRRRQGLSGFPRGSAYSGSDRCHPDRRQGARLGRGAGLKGHGGNRALILSPVSAHGHGLAARHAPAGDSHGLRRQARHDGEAQIADLVR